MHIGQKSGQPKDFRQNPLGLQNVKSGKIPDDQEYGDSEHNDSQTSRPRKYSTTMIIN